MTLKLGWKKFQPNSRQNSLTSIEIPGLFQGFTDQIFCSVTYPLDFRGFTDHLSPWEYTKYRYGNRSYNQQYILLYQITCDIQHRNDAICRKIIDSANTNRLGTWNSFFSGYSYLDFSSWRRKLSSHTSSNSRTSTHASKQGF